MHHTWCSGGLHSTACELTQLSVVLLHQVWCITCSWVDCMWLTASVSIMQLSGWRTPSSVMHHLMQLSGGCDASSWWASLNAVSWVEEDSTQVWASHAVEWSRTTSTWCSIHAVEWMWLPSSVSIHMQLSAQDFKCEHPSTQLHDYIKCEHHTWVEEDYIKCEHHTCSSLPQTQLHVILITWCSPPPLSNCWVAHTWWLHQVWASHAVEWRRTTSTACDASHLMWSSSTQVWACTCSQLSGPDYIKCEHHTWW